MPNIEKTEKVARKLLPIIYVLDTSGSMAGDRIASVNEAMHDTVDVLKEVAADNASAELKIGVLQFGTNAEWTTKNGFIFLGDYYWNDLKTGGLTSFGAALTELDNKLSRKVWLSSDVGFKIPVIIFMTDGEPTDDYQKALDKINESNKWFKVATKIGIAVGEDANREILAKIVGNQEAVISVNDNETLKKLIRVVSVTASMIGSKSRTDRDSQKEILDTIKGETKNDTIITIPNIPEPEPKGDQDPSEPAVWDNDDWDIWD